MGGCGGHQRIVVAYMFRGQRRWYLACSRCDMVDLWGNFARDSTRIKE